MSSGIATCPLGQVSLGREPPIQTSDIFPDVCVAGAGTGPEDGFWECTAVRGFRIHASSFRLNADCAVFLQTFECASDYIESFRKLSFLIGWGVSWFWAKARQIYAPALLQSGRPWPAGPSVGDGRRSTHLPMDEGLPWHQWVKRLGQREKSPARSVWTSRDISSTRSPEGGDRRMRKGPVRPIIRHDVEITAERPSFLEAWV